MKKHVLAVSWIIVIVTLPVLGTLAWNEYNWLQELSSRDKQRIESSMMHSAHSLSKRLQEEILFLPSIFHIKPDELPLMNETLAERYNFWKYYAITPSMLTKILLINKKTDSVSEWDTDHFKPSSKLPAGQNPCAPFNEYDSDITLVMPLLLGLDNYYMAEYHINTKILAGQVIPKLAKDNLESIDLYRYRIVDTRTGTILYSSDKKSERPFSKPDIELPIVWDFHDLGPMQAPPLPSIQDPDDMSSSLPFIKERRPENRMNRPDCRPFQNFSYLVLQIANKDKSLEELSARATVQNAAISFATVIALLLAMSVLAEGTRRARLLALHQQEFVATITHELKTPLAVISSAAQNLGDGLVRDQKKAEQYGTMIRKETARLNVSIDHFLLYSNTHSLSRIKTELCDVHDLVDIALKFTEEERDQYGFTTETRLPEKSVFISGDRIALESVFQNLAQNVLRHARDGKYLGIFVSLDKGSKKDSRRKVSIQFKDKGPGIPFREQKLIFEPFARGKRAIENQIPGNGIGLNLVKRIITMHEGTVRIESKYGNGCTFIITVPESKGEFDV